MVERRLGRGLDFFLSGSRESARDTTSTAPAPGESVVDIEVGKLIANPHQPRREFEAGDLAELTASIRANGILQPILVRSVGDHLQIVAGERRWRAAQQAGLPTVPSIVRAISDEQAAVYALVENLHREDLNAIEKARAFQRLLEVTHAKQETIAQQVGLDRSTVANFLRLLELPGEVQAHVSRGTLSMGQARAILGVPDQAARKALAEQAIRERLSVRQVEALVQASRQESAGDTKAAPAGDGEPAPGAKQRPAWLSEIEDNLEQALEARVSVRYSKRRSRILIEVEGAEEFERLYDRLRGAPPA